MKVLISCSGDYMAPSSRIRGYYISKELIRNGIQSETIFTLQSRTYSMFDKIVNYYKNSKHKFFIIINSLLKLKQGPLVLYVQRDYQYFWIYLLAKFLFKNRILLVFDFDDAIFMYSKFSSITTNLMLKWSDLVFVGSHALKRYSLKYSNEVYLIPSSIYMSKYHEISKSKILRNSKKKNIVIGWIGGGGNLVYLNLLRDTFRRIGKSRKLTLKIISEKRKKYLLESIENIYIKFVEWTESFEIQEMLEFDIGIMPLNNGIWEQYKAGYKIIQYLGLGVPAVASDIGENRYIIDAGKNGFLAINEKEWEQYIVTLVENPKLRRKFGYYGKKKAEEKYSIEKNVREIIKYLTRCTSN